MKTMKKHKRRNLLVFTALVLVLLAVGFGWYWMQNDNDSHELEGVVTLYAEITDMPDPLKSADAPVKMTVKLDDGTIITTYSYCGYTRVEDAPKIDSGLKVGDTVTIHGKVVAGTLEIDVCSAEYYIKKV